MEKPLIDQCSSLIAQISAHPLFSILTTFFLLNLLYLPNLLSLLFSPVLITTSLILTTLLHFASPRSPDTDPDHPNPIRIQLEDSPDELPAAIVELHEQVKTSNIFCNNNFVEWAQKGGPLEVIYEEYEGEGDEGDSAPEHSGQSPEYSASSTYNRLDYQFGYCTSSTESDADSDDGEPSSENNVCFRWDEDEEGMIEIALEEDNLIEIDLSACR